jgi:hypothetical protein
MIMLIIPYVCRVDEICFFVQYIIMFDNCITLETSGVGDSVLVGSDFDDESYTTLRKIFAPYEINHRIVYIKYSAELFKYSEENLHNQEIYTLCACRLNEQTINLKIIKCFAKSKSCAVCCEWINFNPHIAQIILHAPILIKQPFSHYTGYVIITWCRDDEKIKNVIETFCEIEKCCDQTIGLIYYPTGGHEFQIECIDAFIH